jgi:uncharacterized protein YkwD
MPKILSFGGRSKSSRDNLFKGLWEWFGSLEKFVKIYLVSAILIAIATPLLVSSYLIFNPLAASNADIGDAWTAVPDPGVNLPSGDLNPPDTQDYVVDQETINAFNLINQYRAENGLTELTPIKSMTDATKWHGNDMIVNNYFSHTDSLGRNSSERMCDFGYICYPGWKGENIGKGQQTADQIVQGWKDSPGHNSILLGPNYRVIGIYRTSNPNGVFRWYWSADFGDTILAPVRYVTALPPPPPPSSGDANCSGAVNNTDGDLIIRYATGSAQLSETCRSGYVYRPAADVDNSGIVDGQDAFNIYKFTAGLSSILNNNTPTAEALRDDDLDSYTNGIESYIGTSKNSKCGPDAWPPDFNSNGIVNTLDAGVFVGKLNQRIGQVNFNKRLDLTADGIVNTIDTGRLVFTLNRSCTP